MFRWLIDTSDFISRDHCGIGWSSLHITINRVANFTICIAYFSIPLSLFYLWLRTRTLVRRTTISVVDRLILLNFVAFILFCGLTHLGDVLVFEWAPYRLYTLIAIITALFSVSAALILPGVVRRILVACDGPKQEGDGPEAS